MRQTVTINLIRHGQTAGNSKKRYIGTTDEPLSEEGIARLIKRDYPRADAWFLSPMRRCLETAAVAEYLAGNRMLPEDLAATENERLAQGKRAADHAASDFLKTGRKIVVPDFRECDFGMFENKNYLELSDCPEYQAWIDSNGTLPFPGGEAVEEFKERCCRAFERMAEQILEEEWTSVNVVVHGGTIMSIMERFARPEKSYYQWQAENGGGYELTLERESWKKEKVLYDYRER